MSPNKDNFLVTKGPNSMKKADFEFLAFEEGLSFFSLESNGRLASQVSLH